MRPRADGYQLHLAVKEENAVPQKIRDVMTEDVVVMPAEAPLTQASREMRDRDIGDVIVLEGEQVAGILTDRDIVVRAIAEGRSPDDTPIGDVASRDLATLGPDDAVDDAVRIMREQAVRRVPVVEEGRPVGIVSIGDLAVAKDPDSALADISVAEPNE
jgi:CBS domain-containing protein